MDTHVQLTRALSLCLLYAAIAASYGSARVRGRARLCWLDAAPRNLLARGAALAAISVAFKLWHDIEPGPAAGFVVIVGLMVAGTFITVLAPLAPRSIWSTALIALLLIPVLAVARGALP